MCHAKDYKVGTIPIVYGLFRGTDVVIRKAFWSDVDFFYVDHGYMKRGHYDGYYRVVKNGLFHNIFDNWNPRRFEALDIDISPLRDRGDTIILCKPSYEGSLNLPFVKEFPEEWIEGVEYRFRNRGKRLIVSDKEPGNTLVELLYRYDVASVVSHDSNTIVTALLAGVDAINVTYDVYKVFPAINRQLTLYGFANNQFRLNELTPEHFT